MVRAANYEYFDRYFNTSILAKHCKVIEKQKKDVYMLSDHLF